MSKNQKNTDRIKEIENAMLQTDFWNDSEKAQAQIKELQELKDAESGVKKYDRNNAMVTVYAGVGGDDAEDWVRMLLEMYMKFADKQNWKIEFLDENRADHGGYKNITFEVSGGAIEINNSDKQNTDSDLDFPTFGPYGILKHESGVHRLVRKSPFNSAGKRQTSFAMVEVMPAFDQTAQKDFEIPPDELEIEFTKSSGPGGQNVNKRETAVRIVHKPTKISAFVSNERSQIQNKEKALEIIYGKLYNLREEERQQAEKGLSLTTDAQAKWGNQIRSYVLHPYKMVKDHRIDLENSNVDAVLDGEIIEFIEKVKAAKD
jgi:peptide chain release factor 2